MLIQVANTETRLRRIGEEIKKTARRVNALEQVVIPGIRSQIHFIQQVLDQQEQEDIFRLKRVKGKIVRRVQVRT
jgi:V/A-type H+-transporting ATPase subunit D